MVGAPRKRRRLNYQKCHQCRTAKKKCEPTDRAWPQKCDRCIEWGYECSENQRAKGSRLPPSPSSEVTSIDSIQKFHDLSLRVAWVRRLNLYAKSARTIVDERKKLFGACREPVAIVNIFRRITEEEALVFSDIKSCLEEFTPSGYPFVALSSLTFLLATEDSRFKRDQIYQQTRVSADVVDRTRSSGDIGAALTMQEIRLIDLVHSPHWLVEMQKYCHFHGESIQCLKNIHGREVLPMPPLHNLLLLTEAGAFLPLVASQRHLIGQKDMLGRSPLHLALDLGIGENMQASHLVDKSTTTIIDAFGRSPLHIACSKAINEVIKLLLNNDADVDLKDNWGQTPLSWAAVGGHEAVVRLLLDRGADVESKDMYGRTPLSWAAKRGHEAAVKPLLDKGAGINLKGEDGWTPLSQAAGEGHEAVVRLLLEKGATIESNDNSGRTPLWWAAGRGHEAVVRLLLEKGAIIESNDNSGWTPLSWAAGRGHEAVVRLLLEKGATIESKDELGCTPLSWAAEEGYEAVVRLLLEKGATIESNDNRGRTPLSRAAGRGHEAVARLLLEKGAIIESNDNSGWTPLLWAAGRGYEAVV